MEKLIQALQIFAKYKNLDRPTICVHDMLIIMGIEEDGITKADKSLPNFVMSWISRHTLPVGKYYAMRDDSGISDYIVRLPDGSTKMLNKPGPNRIKRFLSSWVDGE